MKSRLHLLLALTLAGASLAQAQSGPPAVGAV